MAKIKTSSLVGPALDWAVAQCSGETYPNTVVVVEGDGWEEPYRPSTNRAQGGLIIEREDIAFRKYHNPKNEAHGKFYARICRESGTMVGWYKTTGWQQTGSTPLIAAMRCYVASKLGDEVDIPEELIGDESLWANT